MSSPKCTVRFLIPLTMWERFVNHEILLKRCYELKEFGEVFVEYEESDAITVEDYYKCVMKDIPTVNHYHGYEWNELEDAAYEWAKKMTFEQFKELAFADPQKDFVKLDKPITVDYSRYYHDNEDHHHTYEWLTANDIWSIVFHWSITTERPEVYFYDGQYEKGIKELREYTRGDGKTKDVFVVREEEC